jgi:2',3'-cyclic-nucleotide 2'-phosphodiesterase (5'-nucleotidase family)
MRKCVSFLGILAVLCFGFSAPAHAKELVILHANDTHSNMFSFGPHDQYGGIARMSTMIKKLRAENPNALVLHAGDTYVGTFAFNKYLGYHEFKIMEGLYDAMCLGNHELDLGPTVLAAVLSGFNPIEMAFFGPPVSLPILSANVDLTELSMLAPFILPWMIKDIDGLKVGIFGVVTDDPIYYSADLIGSIDEPYTPAGMTAAALRNMGCHVVIAVSHLGMLYDIGGLSLVPGIDIIVGGHSHDEMLAQIYNGKIIVQAGEFGKNLGELRVDVGASGITLVSHELHPIDRSVRKDPSLLEHLNELRVGIYQDPRFGPVYSRHVAKARWDHEEKWIGDDPYRDPSHMDTPLGNLIADAIRAGVEEAGYPVDIALEANGYIGHKIYEGKIVGNDLMRTLPYGFDPATGLGFRMKIALLAAPELYFGLEYTVQHVEFADDLSLQVSGLTFAYDSTLPPFNRIDVNSIFVNGAPFDPLDFTAIYAVTLNEKLLEFLEGLGLDLTDRVIDPMPHLLEYNLVKHFMQELNHLRYTSEGRIIDTSKE